MMANRKIKYDRLFLVIFVIALFVVALVFASIAFYNFLNKDEKQNNTIDLADNKNAIIEVLDYQVYDGENAGLNFNFVVANMKFKNDNGINYDLKNLLTNENIRLNDIYMYQKEVNINYDFSMLDTTINIVSSENEYICNIFIPFTLKDSLITINDEISGNVLKIDTSKNKEDINLIKRSSNDNDVVIDSNNYNLSVSKSYISDMMLHNGETFNASALNFYTFNITVNSISDNVKIIGAIFNRETGDSWTCLDASYDSYKIDNIIDRELNVGDTYALFFDISSNGEEEANFKGTITLKFSDGTEITIDTVLN